MNLETLAARLAKGQRLILMHRLPGKWRTLYTNAEGWDFTTGTARLRFLQEVEKASTGMVVMDARNDERFRTFGTPPFRSALCCPVVARWGLAGMLFIEDPTTPRAFSFDHLQRWSAEAKKLADSMPPPAAPQRTPVAERAFRPSWWWLVSVALALVSLVVGLMFTALNKKVPQLAPRAASAHPTVSPQSVASRFLATLNGGDLSAAYSHLASQVQRRYSQASFSTRARNWLNQANRASQLKSCQVRVVATGASRSQVDLVPVGQAPGVAPVSTWYLVKQANDWKILSAGDLLP